MCCPLNFSCFNSISHFLAPNTYFDTRSRSLFRWHYPRRYCCLCETTEPQQTETSCYSLHQKTMERGSNSFCDRWRNLYRLAILTLNVYISRNLIISQLFLTLASNIDRSIEMQGISSSWVHWHILILVDIFMSDLKKQNSSAVNILTSALNTGMWVYFEIQRSRIYHLSCHLWYSLIKHIFMRKKKAPRSRKTVVPFLWPYITDVSMTSTR